MPYIFLSLLCIHFVADFVFQTRWQANNKSSNWLALFEHVATYTTTFTVVGIAQELLGCQWGITPMFLLWTFILHFITDACTSRLTKYFWSKQDEKMFFNVIGFDQLIHAWCLAWAAVHFLRIDSLVVTN